MDVGVPVIWQFDELIDNPPGRPGDDVQEVMVPLYVGVIGVINAFWVKVTVDGA